MIKRRGLSNMSFGFPSGSIVKAMRRQDDGRGLGTPCARCQAYLANFLTEGKGWFAIPVIPIEEGGKTKDNCAIVCPRCFKEIGQDGSKVIPLSALPYFMGKGRR
jgi:hypothetical protein